MNREKFTKELAVCLANKLGDNDSFEFRTITKNNGVAFLAVVLGEKDSRIHPTIYIDDFYEEHINGRSVTDISDAIIALYNTSKEKANFEIPTCADQVKDKIHSKLINTEANRILLDNSPHYEFHDLSVIFYIYLGTDEDGFHKTINISNDLQKILGLSDEELKTLSGQNNARVMPSSITSFSQMLEAAMMFESTPVPSPDETFYVITNDDKFNGAISILYPNVLNTFCQEVAVERLLLIPSSIHEMLILPDRGFLNTTEYNHILNEVNDTVVLPQEVLSKNCYIYNCQTDTISVA